MQASPEGHISITGVSKFFGRHKALDNVSLEIPPGELTFLLGPSGAGKTTLARLVAGLDTLDDGEIFFDDRVMNVVPAHERKIGLVFQDDALWPRLSVAENIGYGLKVQQMPRAERRERVAEAMGAMRIDSLAEKRPGHLTNLQRQRVALALETVSRETFTISDNIDWMRLASFLLHGAA